MPDIVKSRTKRAACAALCAVGYLPLTGCLFQKKPPKAFVPVPVAARVAPLPVDVNLPPDDEEFAPSVDSPATTAVLSLPPAPVKPAVVKPKPPATAEPVIATPTAPAPSNNIPPPKPQTILSAGERRQMTKALDDALLNVKRVLDKAGGKNLPSDLAALAASARTLSEQAERERDRDLPTAVSFAQRAEVYANDLSARMN